MILPYEYPNKNNSNNNKKDNSNLNDSSHNYEKNSSSKELSMDAPINNLLNDFRNNNYHKNTQEYDDGFFDKFDTLKLGNYIKTVTNDNSSSVNDNEISANKEENLITLEVLRLLDSSNKKENEKDLSLSGLNEDIKNYINDENPDPKAYRFTGILNASHGEYDDVLKRKEENSNNSLSSEVSHTSKNYIPKTNFKESPRDEVDHSPIFNTGSYYNKINNTKESGYNNLNKFEAPQNKIDPYSVDKNNIYPNDQFIYENNPVDNYAQFNNIKNSQKFKNQNGNYNKFNDQTNLNFGGNFNFSNLINNSTNFNNDFGNEFDSSSLSYSKNFYGGDKFENQNMFYFNQNSKNINNNNFNNNAGGYGHNFMNNGLNFNSNFNFKNNTNVNMNNINNYNPNNYNFNNYNFEENSENYNTKMKMNSLNDFNYNGNNFQNKFNNFQFGNFQMNNFNNQFMPESYSKNMKKMQVPQMNSNNMYIPENPYLNMNMNVNDNSHPTNSGMQNMTTKPKNNKKNKNEGIIHNQIQMSNKNSIVNNMTSGQNNLNIPNHTNHNNHNNNHHQPSSHLNSAVAVNLNSNNNFTGTITNNSVPQTSTKTKEKKHKPKKGSKKANNVNNHAVHDDTLKPNSSGKNSSNSVNSANNQTPSVGLNPKRHSKNAKQPNYTEMNDEEIIEHVGTLAREQAGCRFLQKKIEDDKQFADEVLFPAIFDNLMELIIDAFGNYLIQKLIECLSEQNLEKIVKLVNPCLLSLGLNAHGTRVVQKIIENIRSEKLLDLFLTGFNRVMLDLMKDINGNHVIIKFVNDVKYPKNKDLYKAIIDNIVEIATHKHACCAFQKCIDYASPEQKKIIIEKLVENTYILISDPYGNYVLQYIIMLNDFKINYSIACIFKNNLGYLSKQKFSSNVIEKCFDFCDENTKQLIVKEVCNPKIITDLLLDMYGNYVLQKALHCATEPYYSILINAIGPHLEKLKTASFGTKLYTKLLITYPELNSFLLGGAQNKPSSKTKVVNNNSKKSNNKNAKNSGMHNNNADKININNNFKNNFNNHNQNLQFGATNKINFDFMEN